MNAQCAGLLAEGLRPSEAARRAGVTIDSLPEDQRPDQLLPLGKMFCDTVKMIASAPRRPWWGYCGE